VFGIDLQTLIQVGINLFNVALLAVALTWLLYRPVREFLHNRELRIITQLEHAKTTVTQADELKAQYQEKLRGIEAEKRQILEEAREIAHKNSKATLEDAKTEAAAIKARAETDIQLEISRINDQVKTAIIDISSAMTEKFVTVNIDKATHDRLFAETVAELEEVPWHS
jgi:F-type H+-transporting ATPase subunit b